jgi:hypothetical protein
VEPGQVAQDVREIEAQVEQLSRKRVERLGSVGWFSQKPPPFLLGRLGEPPAAFQVTTLPEVAHPVDQQVPDRFLG